MNQKLIKLLIVLIIIIYFYKYSNFIISHFKFNLIHIFLFLFFFFLRIIAWSFRIYILDNKKNNLFFYIKLNLLGILYNNFFPLKLGDIAKILILSKNKKIIKGLLIILYDRLGDFSFMFPAFLLNYFFSLLGIYNILFLLTLFITSILLYLTYSKIFPYKAISLTLSTIAAWVSEILAITSISGNFITSYLYVSIYIFFYMIPSIPHNVGIYEIAAIFMSTTLGYKEYLVYSLESHIAILIFNLIISLYFLIFDREFLFFYKFIDKKQLIEIKEMINNKSKEIYNLMLNYIFKLKGYIVSKIKKCLPTQKK